VITVRPARDADDDAIWHILEPVVRTGETYAHPRKRVRSRSRHSAPREDVTATRDALRAQHDSSANLRRTAESEH
jgi:hypothetical protein